MGQRSVESQVPRVLLEQLYQDALPDDVKLLDDLLGVDPQQHRPDHPSGGRGHQDAGQDVQQGTSINISPAIVAIGQAILPHQPSGDPQLLPGGEHLHAGQRSPGGVALPKERIRSSEIRDYLRHLLDDAYDCMAQGTERGGVATMAPLADDDFMMSVAQAHPGEEFRGVGPETSRRQANAGVPSQLDVLNDALDQPARKVAASTSRPGRSAPSAGPIAVDAALLDACAPRGRAEGLRRQRPALRGLVDACISIAPTNHCDDSREGRLLPVRAAPLADHHVRARPGHRPAEHRRFVQPESRPATGGVVRLRHRADQLQPAQYLPPPDPAVVRHDRPEPDDHRLHAGQRHSSASASRPGSRTRRTRGRTSA